MLRALTEHYRCPEEIIGSLAESDLAPSLGGLRVGTAACSKQLDHADSVFDLTDIVDCLRHERYFPSYECQRGRSLRPLYYSIRPFLPKRIRQDIQRAYFRLSERSGDSDWPVNTAVESIFDSMLYHLLQSRHSQRIPFIWFWPGNYSAACVVTHDVETDAGYNFCENTMDLDDAAGIKSSFQIVPEGPYKVSPSLLASMRSRGFEIGVHDFNHDGRLFDNRREFLRRAKKINEYLYDFGATGFRSAVLYRRLDWYHAFDFSYDMSVPNTGDLEVQKGGCCTVFPYFIGNIVELPLTTVQDYVLFELLHDYSLTRWRQQAELVLARNGFISFLVHPDYIRDSRAQSAYVALLEYVDQLRSQRNVWVTLPGELDRWWRLRSHMQLISDGSRWRIQGAGSERARLAYASLESGHLVITGPGDAEDSAGSTLADEQFESSPLHRQGVAKLFRCPNSV